MNADAGIFGGCNCSAVRYVVRRQPLTCYICHCHLCQKRTGSAFSMSLVLPADGVEVIEGEAATSERIRPDGGINRSYECANCDSRLWTAREGAPTVNLRVGTLDVTEQVRPVAQMWVSSAQAWAVQPDILTFEAQPTDAAQMARAWRDSGQRL